MTDVAPDKCTTVEVRFEGEDHQNAAHAFMIQFADGGLDEAIEQRLSDQGIEVVDTDFDLKARTLTIKV